MTAALWLIFARALGFFARAPGISRAGIPVPLRVGFAFALAVAIAPLQRPFKPHDAATLSLLLAGETCVGAVLGLSATLVAEAVSAAGRLLDDFVGLRASVPSIAVAPAGIGGMWALVYATAFFALGGCDALATGFAESFSVVPLGAVPGLAMLHHLGIGVGVAFARTAFELSAPGICVALCIHLGSAALVRVIPRLSGLWLAHPPAFGGVLLVAFVSLAALRELAAG